jgi:tetratricopeptide (TPR) repeat protein
MFVRALMLRIPVALVAMCVVGAFLQGATAAKLETTPAIAALLARGNAHEYRKQYDQAIFDFSEALLLKPSRHMAAELYGQRGGEYVLKEDFERAMADAEEAIRLAPNYFRGYQTRARLFMHRSQFDRAMADINRAIQLQPDFSGLYVNRGNVLEAVRKVAFGGK